MPVVAGLLITILIPACSDETDLEALAPTVQITSGPVEGSTVSYAIEIFWSGSDPDGFVEHFEYAIDPPPEFSEDEIAGKPGTLSVETIPGEAGDPDTTRISKVVGGEVLSFDWIHTSDTSKLFRFTTPEADSVTQDGKRVPTGRFTGMHAVYVRAVDNDGIVSVPDKVAFTSETVAPSSEIVRPHISEDALRTGNLLGVKWDGIDPDSYDPAQKPTHYLIKLVRTDTLGIPPACNLDNCWVYPESLMTRGGEWELRDAAVSEATFPLDQHFDYVFGVRAVDDAGVAEPFLEWGRNAFKVESVSGLGGPALTLTAENQDFYYSGPADGFEMEVLADSEIRCTVSCSAEEYGEDCTDWRWGIDVTGPDDPNWSAWTTDPDFTITFDSVGPRTLYTEARDALGQVSPATGVFRVLKFTFEKDLLFVDDFFDGSFPNDSKHDTFWRDRIRNYGGILPAGVGEFHTFKDNDQLVPPEIPTLEELSHYKLVVWECRGEGHQGETGLLLAAARSNLLGAYLENGGQLWIGGQMTIPPMLDSDPAYELLFYPKNPGPGTFPYEFMKLRTVVHNAKHRSKDNIDNLIKVRPFPGQPEIYPEMNVDVTKLNPVTQSFGLGFVDALFDPLLLNSQPGFNGIVDSLYSYGSTAQDLMDPPRESEYHDKLTALRWHDPDPDHEHGRVQWFGFPLYFFEDSQAQETFNRSLDWFRAESRPQQ